MTRVLVVDDDDIIRQVVSYALSDEGYQVEDVSGGHAALEAVARQRPDIILLDMKMPAMDGWEFVKIYRERYERQAPILVLTAAQDAAKRAAEVNADSYLAKPFALDVLIERVATLTRNAGTPEA